MTSNDEINYYGAIIDIIQLDYSGKYKVVLFKCDWIDIKKGVKKDKFGMTLVNFKFLKHTGKNLWDDPFVFASQAKKVFYVYDERSKDWSVVLDEKVRLSTIWVMKIPMMLKKSLSSQYTTQVKLLKMLML